eukprot:11692580-Alexandrium_andersonii.AAC.1
MAAAEGGGSKRPSPTPRKHTSCRCPFGPWVWTSTPCASEVKGWGWPNLNTASAEQDPVPFGRGAGSLASRRVEGLGP